MGGAGGGRRGVLESSSAPLGVPVLSPVGGYRLQSARTGERAHKGRKRLREVKGQECDILY